MLNILFIFTLIVSQKAACQSFNINDLENFVSHSIKFSEYVVKSKGFKLLQKNKLTEKDTLHTYVKGQEAIYLSGYVTTDSNKYSRFILYTSYNFLEFTKLVMKIQERGYKYQSGSKDEKNDSNTITLNNGTYSIIITMVSKIGKFSSLVISEK